jgi:pilus assembly protein Flp/PilA
MRKLKIMMNDLIRDDSGQDLIEYALVAALIGLAAITVLKSVATAINSIFTSIATNLTSAV